MSSTLAAHQAKIFAPAPVGTRKVILATNVAETSITIPGIKYVIDTGLCKEKNYINRRGTGIETLEVKQISRSAAQQRTGRAGREGPGFCYRLFTEKSFKQMELSPKPEILRTNLAQVVLQLKELGIQKLDEFEFLDAPDPEIRKCLPSSLPDRPSHRSRLTLPSPALPLSFPSQSTNPS